MRLCLDMLNIFDSFDIRRQVSSDTNLSISLGLVAKVIEVPMVLTD